MLGVRSQTCQSTQNKKFTYLCNISRKTSQERSVGKLIFCMQISTIVSYIDIMFDGDGQAFPEFPK